MRHIILSAQEVYDELGPGHSEAVYEAAMAIELSLNNIDGPIARQVPCPVIYKGFTVGITYVDILIDSTFLIELKAINKITSKEEQQVRKYLQSLNLERGLLVNFGPELEIKEITLDDSWFKVSRESRDSERSLLSELYNQGIYPRGYYDPQGPPQGRLGEVESEAGSSAGTEG